MKRVVIDTGVVISAALKKDGTSRKAFIKAINTCIPLLAIETMIELEEVLGRAKFGRFILGEDKIAILELVAQRGELVEITSDLKLCRDFAYYSFAIIVKSSFLIRRPLPV